MGRPIANIDLPKGKRLSDTAHETIDDFSAELRNEVLSLANQTEGGLMLPEAFTEHAMDAMTETGDWPESYLCSFHQTGSEISGWGWDAESGTMNMAVTAFAGHGDVTRLPKAEADAKLRRLRRFFEQSLKGAYEELEESSPAFDLAHRIWSSPEAIAKVRLFLLTDQITANTGGEGETINGIATSTHVWDLGRLYRLHSSGRARERIDINILDFRSEGLPYLEAPTGDPDLQSYLLIVPGQLLADLYNRFGPQLLELNVRSFLQAKGKVNRGIRQTVMDQPERIFAYNNGISATASSIRVERDEAGAGRIVAIEDLQIVNGGQTTASIATVHHRDKQPVDGVAVQAKLTVVPAEKVQAIVPQISRFANSQNAVSEADLTANDEFHVALEKLSRSIWAPAVDGTTNSETRWFYERARGQYQDALSRQRTPAKKKDFKRVHPMAQKFTKTDVAKYENTWGQRPHIVSRGAQKSFFEFMEARAAAGDTNRPGTEYFQQLCAKALMFKAAEKIVSAQKFGGYRANIVTYTLSLINRQTEQQIDLNAIWRSQSIGPALSEAIEEVCHLAFDVITHPPGGQNVTEWCKREDCWDAMKELELDLGDLRSELVDQRPDIDDATEALVAGMTSDAWDAIAQWIEEEKRLSSSWRQKAKTVERLVSKGKTLSPTQLRAAVELFEAAREAGFDK